MTFKTRELTPRIATEIIADKATLLGGEYAGTIRELLEQRGVLVFPKIDCNDDELLVVAIVLAMAPPRALPRRRRHRPVLLPLPRLQATRAR